MIFSKTPTHLMQAHISNLLSAYPLFIRMVLEETDTELAIATGFLYELDNICYLITNGHCVTRVNPETNTRISDKAGFPTTIRANYKTTTVLNPATGDKTISMEGYSFTRQLYTDEYHTEPVWLVHPEFGYKVDVIAIPLESKSSLPDYLANFTLNTYPSFPQKVEQEAILRVADEVYILGYPLGITNPMELPIWKRGSIASEPGMLHDGKPAMLVDTATRAGMSGSPVILMKRGSPFSRVFGIGYDQKGEFSQFVGIYSGRIGSTTQTGDAQLGIVWRKEVIEQIIRGGRRGTIEFQSV